MALTNQQIAGLDIASQRKAAGTATETDVANLNYAAKQGYVYKPAAPSSAPASVNPNPAPADNANPAAANPSPAPAGTDMKSNMPVYGAEEAKQKGMTDKSEDDYLSAKITSPEMIKKKEIDNLVNSGRAFTEEDAKNFAYAKGEKNWQQYVNGVGGQTDPNYIGATNWARLQKTYTPYQLEKATIRTKNGIYWNPEINIAEIPKADPAERINDDTKQLADVISSAKDEADKFTNEDAKKTDKPALTGELEDDKSTIMSMLSDQLGGTAEATYNELFNTQEMKSAQTDVNTYKKQLDEYDQQIDELKDDIRREVEGEASDSYISALATVRGEKILKMKRATQRDYDTALAVYNGLKENAANLLSVRVKDSDTRYNRLWQFLEYETQQGQIDFNNQMTMLQFAQGLSEGRQVQLQDGSIIKGLKENDDINVVEYVDANGKMWVKGIDKKTGYEKYNTYIGQGKVGGSGSGSGSGSEYSAAEELNEYNATQELNYMKEADKNLAEEKWATGYDENGDPFYYDKEMFDKDYEEATSGWAMFKKNPKNTDAKYRR